MCCERCNKLLRKKLTEKQLGSNSSRFSESSLSLKHFIPFSMLFQFCSRASMQRTMGCAPLLFTGKISVWYHLSSSRSARQKRISILNPGIVKFQSYASVFPLCKQLCIRTFSPDGFKITKYAKNENYSSYYHSHC